MSRHRDIDGDASATQFDPCAAWLEYRATLPRFAFGSSRGNHTTPWFEQQLAKLSHVSVSEREFDSKSDYFRHVVDIIKRIEQESDSTEFAKEILSDGIPFTLKAKYNGGGQSGGGTWTLVQVSQQYKRGIEPTVRPIMLHWLQGGTFDEWIDICQLRNELVYKGVK
jgi:hypothetical protein